MDSSEPRNPFEAPQAAIPVGRQARPWNPVGALSFGWNAIVRDPLSVLLIFAAQLVAVAPAICGALVAVLAAQTGNDTVATIGIVVYIASAVLVGLPLSLWVAAGTARYSLLKARGQRADFADLFRAPFWSALGAAALFGIGVFFGTLLCIVPAVILALGLYVWQFVLADRRTGPLESLVQCWKLTSGHKLELLVFVLLAILVSFAATVAGLLMCLVGVLVTAPAAFALISIATAYIYLKLNGEEPVEAA
jgi:uncharacterized membrane protein